MAIKNVQSETKKVPKLRFSGFSGMWEEKKLGDLGGIIGGGTPDTTKDQYWNGEVNWFTPTEIKRKYAKSSLRKISDAGLKNSSAQILPIGTLLFTSRATVGDVSISTIECATNQGFQSVVVNKENSNEFIYYWILKNKKEFIRKANGSTFLEVSGKEIRKMKSFFPRFLEQQKVAEFLGSVDEWIENLRAQKESFEAYKKGIMQKIFSQEIRFKDDQGNNFPKWAEKELGDICNITTGNLDANAMVKNGKYRFYTCAKDFYFIDVFAFDTEALLISGNGANVGYIHYYKGKFNAYQRTYVLDKFSQYIFYIKYYLDKTLHKRISLEKKEGNTPYIVRSTLSEMKVLLPSVSEQQKIADFLTSIDKIIESKQQQITQAEQWKKGLMQGLFV